MQKRKMKKSDNLINCKIDNMPDQFVPRLMNILAERNIAPKTFSREMGCSVSTAYEWIYAYRIPRATNFFAICEFLDVDPRYLWGITDEMGCYYG